MVRTRSQAATEAISVIERETKDDACCSREEEPAVVGAEPRLVSFAEAPLWLQDNHYISHGYRVNHGFWMSLKSIATLHNESLNIWTHLLGFLIFLFLTYYTFTYHLPLHMKTVFADVVSGFPDLHLSQHIDQIGDKIRTQLVENWANMPDLPTLPELADLHLSSPEFWQTLVDHWRHIEQTTSDSILTAFPFLDSGNHTHVAAPLFGRLWPLHRDAPINMFMFGLFFGGAMCCLFFSFVFHTFMCTSPRWCTILCRLDYASISIMIAASACPAVFYGHYCHVWWRYFWLVCICLACALGVCVSMMDRFSANEWRAFRAATFVGVGFSGVFPLMHHAIREQGIFTESTGTLTLKLIIMAALYVLGAVLFATRTPERFFPGKCNIWFHSHQLHHVCVVVAAYMHWTGLLSSFEYRMAHPCTII